MFIIAAAFLATATPARVVQVDGRAALKIQGHVYSLGEEFPFHIGNDVVQTSSDGKTQSLQLIRCGKSIGTVDLTEAADKWLQDDTVWGGHENGNQVRYLVDRYGGTLHADLTECLPNADGTALGVLTLRAIEDWHKLATAQVFIRIARNPLRIAEFRFLKAVTTPYTPAPMSDVPRLYRCGAKEFLIDGTNIEEIDATGKPVRTVGTLPAGAAPFGMSADRWIDFQQFDPKGGQTWLAFDLKTSTMATVFKIPYKPHPYDTENIECGLVDSHSSYLLFERRIYIPDHTEFVTVHVPDGKVSQLSKPAFRVLGDYACNNDGKIVTLYSAATGKLIQEIALPTR